MLLLFNDYKLIIRLRKIYINTLLNNYVSINTSFSSHSHSFMMTTCHIQLGFPRIPNNWHLPLLDLSPNRSFVESFFEPSRPINCIHYFYEVRIFTYNVIYLHFVFSGWGRKRGCYILSPLELTPSSVFPVHRILTFIPSWGSHYLFLHPLWHFPNFLSFNLFFALHHEVYLVYYHNSTYFSF